MARSQRNPRQAAIEIVRKLRANGHVALLAGGCVRDMLIELEPEDYDVATDAVPERIVELFPKTRQVGAQFGVVLVRQGGVLTEVATFRSDHHYEDGRHPVDVTFSNPEQDALRRDFTINGMFYDPVDEAVIDYVGGRDDLRDRVIRTIGPPDERFAEDHLRLIRTIRFAARLQYRIDPETRRAIREHAASLARVSAERVREELDKMMVDPHRAEALRALASTGLIDHLWPDADWTDDRVALSVDLLDRLPERLGFALPLACLLVHWSGKTAGRICRDLTCSNDLRKRVVWLVGHRDALCTPDDLGLADFKLLMQHEAFGDLLDLTRAWLGATGRPSTAYNRAAARAQAIPPDEVAPPPLVDGEDLIAMGLSPGPAFKRILDRVYRAQLANDINDRSGGLAMARRLADLP